ncbi:MAG TPA: tetratricopeptide repeat protein [Ktedonobacterales bacterium]|nr:tetratricopeptide repeat protein [Ktedonobacterales bacterium]
MAASSSQRTKAFISYSHKDRTYLEELHEHLAHYEKQGLIHYWDDQKLTPGMPWEDNIKQAITSAKVAILLVSPSFLASEFINSHELPPLLEAAQNEGALLLVVILRYCLFAHTPLAKFQTVNNPSEPLSEKDQGARDRIWVKVVELVSKALNEHQHPDQPQPLKSPPAPALRTAPAPAPAVPQAPEKNVHQWFEEGVEYSAAGNYEMALTVFDRTIQLDPTNADYHFARGYTLNDLQRYEEALTALQLAIQLNPNDAYFHVHQGIALFHLKQYHEAWRAFTRAIRIDPANGFAYHNMGMVFKQSGQKAEAEQAYKKARALGYKDDE